MYRSNGSPEYRVSHGSEFDSVEFESLKPSGDPKVDRVKALLYKANKPKGAVIFVHGTGQRNFEPLKYYPEHLAESGYVTMMPVLPYHFERTPDGSKSGTSFIRGTDVQLAKRFDQAVVDLFSCIDYLEKLGFKKVNIIGFSFGGMVSTITMALDRRIEKGVFVVSGGNYEYITWKSIATKVLRVSYEENKACTPRECEKKHKFFDEAIQKFNSIEDLAKMPPCFTYDPSLFARFIPPRKTLFFTAIFDPFIPRASSDDLWERLGKPKRYMMPSGHLGAHLFFKHFILKKTIDFFENKEE